MRVAFVGGGTMGEAIASSLLAKGMSSPAEVSVSDVVETRLDYMKIRYGVNVTSSNKLAIDGAEVVVLAVKPQSLVEVLPGMSGTLTEKQLVLSIMAGATISSLRDGLKHKEIVRSMPNTPAQIGMGMTVWTATPEVTDHQKSLAKTILSVMGKELYVTDERSIDMATAVSGSGPAYFFLFAEAIIDAAVTLGLPRDAAKAMVQQTMLGSAHLMESSGREAADLRQSVTSKGGTTAAALGVFESGDFRNLVAMAVEAAYKRARQLGGEKP